MQSFTTLPLAPNSRVEHWLQAVRQAFAQLNIEPLATGLQGQLRWRDLGRARIVHAAGTAQTICRTESMIGTDPAQQVILMAHRLGHATLLHQGRSVNLRPGMVIAMDTASPYRLTFHDAFEQDILRFPSSALRFGERQLASLAAVPLPAGTARDWLCLGLAQSRMQASVELGLESPLIELASLALSQPPEGELPLAPKARVAQARAFIRANARSPDLTPSVVAQALGVSLRSLQKGFAAVDDHPAACIQRERLGQARAALTDPRLRSRAIAALAAQYGFADASHFIRVFRQHYGITPGEYRRRSCAAPTSALAEGAGPSTSVSPSDESQGFGTEG